VPIPWRPGIRPGGFLTGTRRYPTAVDFSAICPPAMGRKGRSPAAGERPRKPRKRNFPPEFAGKHKNLNAGRRKKPAAGQRGPAGGRSGFSHPTEWEWRMPRRPFNPRPWGSDSPRVGVAASPSGMPRRPFNPRPWGSDSPRVGVAASPSGMPRRPFNPRSWGSDSPRVGVAASPSGMPRRPFNPRPWGSDSPRVGVAVSPLAEAPEAIDTPIARQAKPRGSESKFRLRGEIAADPFGFRTPGRTEGKAEGMRGEKEVLK